MALVLKLRQIHLWQHLPVGQVGVQLKTSFQVLVEHCRNVGEAPMEEFSCNRPSGASSASLITAVSISPKKASCFEENVDERQRGKCRFF